MTPDAQSLLETLVERVQSADKGQKALALNQAVRDIHPLLEPGDLESEDVFSTLILAATSDGLGARQAEHILRGTLKSLTTKKVASTKLVNPLAEVEPDLSDVIIRCTDWGNSQRFVHDHQGRVRFVTKTGVWLIWDGRRWAIDENKQIYRLGRKTVKNIYREAAEGRTSSERGDIAKHAIKSESKASIESMLGLSESEPGVAVTPNELDCDPWLLNCQNGTLDLQTGILHDHRRDDLLTKAINTNHDPDAICPVWLKFLDRIMEGNQTVIDFLQRAVGYTLTADTSEQCLFFMEGKGKNGKTTFAEALKILMGDYALTTPAETFLSKRGEGGVRNDLARLPGARLVVGSELEENRKLDEALVKTLTGSDEISARFLHKEFFSFRPTHKLWMFGNHKPIIKGNDEGIWRRMIRIPFNATIQAHEQDKHLNEKLALEMAGILQWALEGCLIWQTTGLNIPPEIVQATKDYRAEMDIIAAWIDECTTKITGKTSARELYSSYTTWCDANGEIAVNQRRFGGTLTEKGYTRNRITTGFVWEKIGLLNS